MIPGGADKSYGIHVAQLAGLPKAVIHRAEAILLDLENSQSESKDHPKKKLEPAQSQQLSIFGSESQVEEEIRSLDIDSMSPIEAINKLYELKKKAGKPDQK